VCPSADGATFLEGVTTRLHRITDLGKHHQYWQQEATDAWLQSDV